MNDIKLYEELSYIYTYDDKAYPTTLPMKDLEKVLNSNLKFINLGNDLVAISSIKRVEVRSVDSVDNALLQISDTTLRESAAAEINKRRKNWDRVNIEILNNILDRLTD